MQVVVLLCFDLCRFDSMLCDQKAPPPLTLVSKRPGERKWRGMTSPHRRGKGSEFSWAGGPNAERPEILVKGAPCSE